MSCSRSRVLRHALCLLLAGFLQTSEALVIDLPGLGLIEGTTTQSHWTGRTIYQYKGIPFAEPPVGELRFKRPVKFATPWDGIRNFTDFGAICPQGSGFLYLDSPHKAVQDEDCLTLNVYTNKVENVGVGFGFPVMFFIHGGGFIMGHAQSNDPFYLLHKDVVLVTTQYRLGPLGFLSLKTEEMPGNQGMLDVIMALEWVRDNIEHFGGDPSRVTIFGQSAGAAAVTSLLFSPLAEGLFHQIIAHSGSVLGTWATDPDPVKHGRSIGRYALCMQTDLDALAACLRGKTVNQILAAHTAFLSADVASGGRAVGGHHLVWDEAGSQSFLRDDPAQLLTKGNFMHIPMIAGVTKHEASGFLAVGYDYLIKPLNLDTNVEFLKRKAVKQILDFCGIEDQTGYTRSFFRDKYFPNGELGNFTEMIPGMIDMLSVGFLKAATLTMAAEMSLYADTFFYSFNFFGSHSSFPDPNPYPFEAGINHGDDLYYIFQMGRELTEEEDAMAKKMTELWGNFATYGVPMGPGVTQWLPMTEPEGPYMKFQNNKNQMYDNFVGEEYMITINEGLLPLPPEPETTTDVNTEETTDSSGGTGSVTPTTTRPTTTTSEPPTPSPSVPEPSTSETTDDPGAASTIAISLLTLSVAMAARILY